MAAETFLGWAKRVTRAGIYDFTDMIRFVTSVEGYWSEQKGRPWTCPGWKKTRGRVRGKGRFPRTMSHPETGEQFVFPIVEAERERAKLIKAVVCLPTCSKCGAEMVREAMNNGQGDLFHCPADCRGRKGGVIACLAWTEVTGTGLPKDLGDGIAPPAPPVDRERVTQKIVDLVAKARKVTEDHGMTLPIGYRTTRQLAALTLIAGGSVDEAWKLWVDGRVSKQERDKFDAAGLPAGQPRPINPIKDQPSFYGTAAAVLDAGFPVFLVGAAGTGKTRFAKWYAERTDRTLTPVVGSGDVAGRELWCTRRDAKGGEVTTVLGPAARALTGGDLLFVDEIDAFDSNSLIPLNAPLNGDRVLSVPVIGEVVVNKDARILAAANTNGRSKDRTYNARNRLDGAFLNRFAVIIRSTYEAKVDRKVAGQALAEVLERMEGQISAVD